VTQGIGPEFKPQYCKKKKKKGQQKSIGENEKERELMYSVGGNVN
jgi:hypothetical protein